MVLILIYHFVSIRLISKHLSNIEIRDIRYFKVLGRYYTLFDFVDIDTNRLNGFIYQILPDLNALTAYISNRKQQKHI